jgi:hypothetical protein
MARRTAFQIPNLPRDRPTVPEVVPIIRALYRRHSAGCCWHVVLDDGNYDSVAWSVARIEDEGCYEAPATECLELAKLLPKMTVTQIRKAAALGTSLDRSAAK